MRGQIEGQISIFDILEKPKKQGTGNIHRYLRYGPHTLIPEVREETKAYLEKNGVPEWVKWDRDSLACSNCEHYDGEKCIGGGGRYHREFGYKICDLFNQSIVQRLPSTARPFTPAEEYFRDTGKTTYWQGSQGKPHEWWKEKDGYIREHPDCFYVYGHYLSRADGWHKVPDELPTYTEWTVIDVVLFGKKTGTPWMEHEKWEAKDWTFRGIDEGRDKESIEILAWAPSERGEDGKNQNTCTI